MRRAAYYIGEVEPKRIQILATWTGRLLDPLEINSAAGSSRKVFSLITEPFLSLDHLRNNASRSDDEVRAALDVTRSWLSLFEFRIGR